MGVLNVTPDSFSDGGRLLAGDGSVDVSLVEREALAMAGDGAVLIDIGGESTRPGAAAVDVATELARVIPVMERLRGLDTLLSVDTRKTAVAKAAIDAGCHFVNDISAASDGRMLEIVAASGAAICLMHMQGQPESMQKAPAYSDVVAEVVGFLAARAERALAAGVGREQIVLDPGIGFGKTVGHNLDLIARLTELCDLGYPVLVGVSRKSTLGQITGRAVGDRLAASIALATLAADRGASIVRAHDVRATCDAMAVQSALRARPLGASGVRRGDIPDRNGFDKEQR